MKCILGIPGMKEFIETAYRSFGQGCKQQGRRFADHGDGTEKAVYFEIFTVVIKKKQAVRGLLFKTRKGLNYGVFFPLQRDRQRETIYL